MEVELVRGRLVLGDVEDRLFGLAQQLLHVAGLETVGDDLAGGVDELALDGLVPDDLGVVQGVGRADHGIGQFEQVDGTAEGVQGAGGLQVVLDRDQVDGDVFLVKLYERLKNLGVGRGIEIVGVHDVHQFVEHGVGLEHAAENGLLGFQVMGRDFA